MEKLKAREQIMFFDEVLLFEDELHDHGVSMISVKIVSSYATLLILIRSDLKRIKGKTILSSLILLCV